MDKTRTGIIGRKFSVGLVLIAALFWSLASAADVAPLLPQTPDTLPTAPPQEEMAVRPEPAADRSDPNAVLVERLHAISFEYYAAGDAPAELGLSAAPTHSVVAGVTNIVEALGTALSQYDSDLSKTARAVMAGPLTWAMLDALTLAATRAARECGWSLARAYVPAQELTGGRLRIEIIPVWLHGVTVEGARWSNARRLAKPYRAFVGGIIDVDNFVRVQRSQSGHPFRSVVPSLTPGGKDGTTDIQLNVDERRPFRLFAGYHTTHSRNTGRGRYTAGATMAAPWRTDDILTVQYSTDNKHDHLDSVATVYRMTLPWSHILTVTGLWSKSDSVSDMVIYQKSEDYMLRLNYAIPLPDFLGWTSQVELGWEWRRSEATSRLDFLGLITIPLADNTYVSAPFSIGWNGRRWDRLGATSLSTALSYSPGNYLNRMDRTNYRQNREGATAHWWALQAEVRRDWMLPWDFRAMQRVWGQTTSDRLVDSAQFYLGGNNGVRGYRESEVSGDYGLGMTHELLSPSLVVGAVRLSDPDSARLAKLPDVRLAGFWDWGQVRRKRPATHERKSTTLCGAGVGVRVNWGEYVSAQIDYAWRLRDTGSREDDRKNGYLHAAVQIGF